MALRFGFACGVAMGLGTVVQAAFPTGCVGKGEVYLDPIPGMVFPINISSAELCQAECVDTVNCTHFGFWPDDAHCWLGSGPAWLRETSSPNTIFGPKICEDPPPACTEKPADSFPGTSMAMDWPVTGFQPQTLQCYDKACTAVTTLESTADGWPGLCKGLTEVTPTAGQTCESSCLENPSCPGFQVGRDDTCWQGIGLNCYSTDEWDPTFAPVAKRFQRGEITVLKELSTMRVDGLVQVFNDTEFRSMPVENGKKACANVCYSILECEYWSLSEELGPGGGCWVDAYGRVPYPLLAANMLEGGPYWIAGEYIQRYCPPIDEVPIEEDSSIPIWAIVLFGLLGFACIIGAVLAYLYFLKKKPAKKGKSKKKASTKHTTEPSAAAPLVQPVQMVAYPMPAYQLVPANQVAVATQQVPVAMAQSLQVAAPSVTYTTAPAVLEAPAAAPYTYTTTSAAAPVTYLSGTAPAAGTAPAYGSASVMAPAY